MASSRKTMINSVMGYTPKKKTTSRPTPTGGAEYMPQRGNRTKDSGFTGGKRPPGVRIPPGLLKTTEELKKQPRTQSTTRGKRRLSFAQAYSRRTTDSSRARVLELYGRKKPPKGFRGRAKYFND